MSLWTWSYALDWGLIILALVLALLLANVPPDSHTFSVLDLSISHAHRDNTKVPLWLLVFLAVVFPVATICFACLYSRRAEQVSALVTPAPRVSTSHHHQWWDLHAALLGFGVSMATATIIYTTVKNLTGKPRPDFLAICQPDLSSVEAHTVGGYGQSISPLWVVVTRGICQQEENTTLHDALRSFPSGYATVAFAGLWYLSLWLSARCDLLSAASRRHSAIVLRSGADEASDLLEEDNDERLPTAAATTRPMQSSAPPLYLLFLPYVPLGLAIFVAGTRYFDFRSHGGDVIAGSVLGAATAWFGFRLYHPALADADHRPWPPRPIVDH